MGEFFRRFGYLVNRRRRDEELQNDLEFHREMAAREGRGREFGNVLRLREQSREAWGWTWIDRLGQDLSYAVRTLRRSPGFAWTAVLVLALGIGVNVTAFSLFNLVALKPLPVPDAASIVRLERRSPEMNMGQMPYPSVVFYRDHAKTLSAVMAVMGVPPMQMDGDEQMVTASFATANYFAELGARAAVGRLFEQVDDRPDAPGAVVLSYGLWQRRFGADPSIVGRVIHLNKKPVTVIGVTPYAFASLGGQTPDIWLPMGQQPYLVDGSKVLMDSSANSVRMWARLAPGVTAQMAEQDLLALTNELRREHPKDIYDNEFIHSEPGGHLQVMQPNMYRVAGLVGLLTLLILAVACTNLGGLLLARGVTREHEMGIRRAIGASKARIFRQLFTESLLLAVLGSVAGLVLGCAVLRVTLAMIDAQKWLSAMPDWRVLLFSMGMAVGAAMFFGLMPALQMVRQRHRGTLARQMLVGVQVAASCVLLIVAGLLVRATHHALYTWPGFGYEQVWTVDPQLGQHGYEPTAARAYLEGMESRLRGAAGVTSVALVKLPPMGHAVSNIGTEIGGHAVDIYPNWVEPGFFEAMSIPLLRGRNLLPGEKNAVIVSESLARRQWPGQDPIGKPFTTGGPASRQSDTVVGVAGDARVNALSDDDATELYWAAHTDDMPGMSVVVKTAGTVAGLPGVVKAIAGGLDPKVFPEVRSIKVLFRENVAGVEKAAMVVSLIGMVAVLLAGVGIVGLVMYTVSQRTKEIAIRLALGAGKGDVLGAVLRQFCWPVGLGLVAGTVGAAGLSQILRKVLYGVSGLDALSYVSAVGLLVGIIFVAAVWPARRALRVDPVGALRCE